MIPRKKLDIGWRDLLAGMAHCLLPADGRGLQGSLEEEWAEGGHAVACLSVRSGFDLLLTTLRLPPGSEVLLSAVTIRDMVRIIEHHRLVPVPVDMDMATLSVDLGSLGQALTHRSRILLVAHLFGSRMPMDPLAEFAREHDLLLLEDCAQAYVGNDYGGHPKADVSLFSFGPIKTNTALGGALLRFRDAWLADEVRAAQETLPLQGRLQFFGRLVKYLGIKVVLLRPVFTTFRGVCAVLGRSHDEVITGAVRGFPGTAFFSGIRRRPSSPLLALLRRRLRRFGPERIRERVLVAQAILEPLPGLRRPGAGAGQHSHWVVPMQTPTPDRTVRRLWREGLDATRGASSLHVVSPPKARSHPPPVRAREAMAEVVYLPVYPGMPGWAIRKLRRTLAEEIS